MSGREIAVFVLFLGCAWALSTATVRGDVTDSQGAPILDAIISVDNTLTGFSRQTLTGESGALQITNLPFQTYSLSVSKDGFAPSVQQLHLRSNVPQVIKVQLTV